MRSVLLVCSLLFPVAAQAQVAPPPPPRGDVAVSIGWLHVPFEGLGQNPYRHDDWTHHVTANGAAGFYWNDHWKTEFAYGISNEAWAWDADAVFANGQIAQRSIDHRVRYTQLSVAQLYQFRRNEWVHPSIGAGLKLQGRSGTSTFSSAVIYPRFPGTPVTVKEPEQHDLNDHAVLAPFAVAGLKAYFTPRGFFRTDLQVAFARNVESVVVHAGVGFDF